MSIENNKRNDIPIRIVYIGNVDSGKTTLMSVLSNNTLDNGNGLARSKIFKHPHEQESGRTSSISMKFTNILGKEFIFTDLCGHERYLKTTIFGMNLVNPDYYFLIIGANMGVSRMTREHLNIALSLNIPLIVCITKIDICPPHILKHTLSSIQNILKNYRKKGMLISDQQQDISNFIPRTTSPIIPIIKISNVTGENIDFLRTFISKLETNKKYPLDKPIEFQIDDSYNITGIGIVISGTLLKGILKIGDILHMGTDINNAFTPVCIKSIYLYDKPSKEVIAGQHVTMNIKTINRKTQLNKDMIRKGMVLVPKNNTQIIHEFTADIYILHHQTTISGKNNKKGGYQPIIHCNGVRQTAEILKIYNQNGILRSKERAKVSFKFLHHGEYIRKGQRIIFREGQARGIGKIIDVVG